MIGRKEICIKVAAYIERYGLLSHEGLHLTAVSGGADSVALLVILQNLGYRIEAAHCNFHLRGEESDRDEAFVAQLCRQKGVPLHLAHFDTREYAALHKVSIEMAARELRYRYFEQLRQDIGADTICVAHHRDDSVETMLMNLMRGTGLHGMTGIRPVNGRIVRPMLCVGRHEIEEFLHSIGQDYVTDSTNLQPDAALRNNIRLRLLPLMQQIVPNSPENMAHTADHLAEADQCLDAFVDAQLASLIMPAGADPCSLPASIGIDALDSQPSPTLILMRWLAPYGFTPAQISDIARHRPMPTGREFLSATHILLADRGRLVLSYRETTIPSMKIPETGVYRIADGLKLSFAYRNEVDISKSADCATLDKASVRFPLTVRTAEPGDRFCPFGMKGSRLVSDYLTDLKRSLLEKRRQLVVADADGNIVWLVGLRTDNRFKVGPSTTSILRIERLTD